MRTSVMEIVEHASEEQSRLFDAWREANARALSSKDIRDGIAAGKAWGRFLYSFAPTAPRADGQVTRLDDRRRL
jgi:hypothetical protein